MGFRRMGRSLGRTAGGAMKRGVLGGIVKGSQPAPAGPTGAFKPPMTGRSAQGVGSLGKRKF